MNKIDHIEYHHKEKSEIEGIELMRHSITWESGDTSDRYGIVSIPLDKPKDEIKLQLKKAIETGKHISSQASNSTEIECLWELGFRSPDGDDDSLEDYLDDAKKYSSVYMEVNNPQL